MAERKSILLRLQPEAYAALQRWAADEFRSLNGQIEFVLDQALKQAGRTARRKGGAPEPPAAEPPEF
jgi:hypothetical protein